MPSKLELENLKLQRLNATLKPLDDIYEGHQAITITKSTKSSDKKKSRSTRKRWESTSSEEEDEAVQQVCVIKFWNYKKQI